MLTEDELRGAWRTLSESRGNISEAARRLGINRSTFKSRLERAVLVLGEDVTASHVGGSLQPLETFSRPLPKRGVKRYILSCAQNNTFVHAQLWKNLSALAEHRDAEILISRFNYNLGAYGRKAVKPGKAKTVQEIWYAPEAEEHASDDRVQLAPGLVWCGELQIEPTANRPLSGFETYTGRNSCIVPHTTVAMESVASGKEEATKLMYSTGCITELNYIQKRAGLKAESRHVFGALLVEVDPAGNWFVRQLEQGQDGRLFDLTDVYEDGVRYPGQRVEAVHWGDTHADRADDGVLRLSFGKGGMLDELNPGKQIFHDLLNMGRRGHHDRKHAFKMLQRHAEGRDLVFDELKFTGEVLNLAHRAETESIVINSNHDRHLKEYLQNVNWQDDLPNAELLLELQLAQVRAIKRFDKTFDITEHAIRMAGCPADVRFLRLDEKLVLCPEHGDGIEAGMHGDLGPNGSKGTAASLAKMGRPCNIGHSHSARIVDDVYQAGTSSAFDMEYNPGPSSWTHSHIITYPNGTRTIVTMWRGKWRA